jgi:hypothetical protein
MAKFKNLGTTATNQSRIHEEIKNRLKTETTCCCSVQSILYFRFLSKNLKVKIYQTVILTVILCGCEILSLTLREEYRLKVFENRMLRMIFGSKKRCWRAGENCIMRSFITGILYHILLR